jgi:hypothetical protein
MDRSKENSKCNGVLSRRENLIKKRCCCKKSKEEEGNHKLDRKWMFQEREGSV